MNTKFLFAISFFAALLCHLFVFNFCAVMFSIDSGALKPTFFFLGPILQKSDVNQNAKKDAASGKSSIVLNNLSRGETALKNVHYEIAPPEENPFTIKTIRKPLVPQTSKTQEKILLKSIFQLPSEGEQNEGIQNESADEELNIQPYRPLRSRLP